MVFVSSFPSVLSVNVIDSFVNLFNFSSFPSLSVIFNSPAVNVVLSVLFFTSIFSDVTDVSLLSFALTLSPSVDKTDFWPFAFILVVILFISFKSSASPIVNVLLSLSVVTFILFLAVVPTTIPSPLILSVSPNLILASLPSFPANFKNLSFNNPEVAFFSWATFTTSVSLSPAATPVILLVLLLPSPIANSPLFGFHVGSIEVELPSLVMSYPDFDISAVFLEKLPNAILSFLLATASVPIDIEFSAACSVLDLYPIAIEFLPFAPSLEKLFDFNLFFSSSLNMLSTLVSVESSCLAFSNSFIYLSKSNLLSVLYLSCSKLPRALILLAWFFILSFFSNSFNLVVRSLTLSLFIFSPAFSLASIVNFCTFNLT